MVACGFVIGIEKQNHSKFSTYLLKNIYIHIYIYFKYFDKVDGSR